MRRFKLAGIALVAALFLGACGTLPDDAAVPAPAVPTSAPTPEQTVGAGDLVVVATPELPPVVSPEPTPEPNDEPMPMATEVAAVGTLRDGEVDLGTFRVSSVVDGDTIRVVGLDERVRMIGIDTPERGECGFEEASAELRRLIDGQAVRLIGNPDNLNDRFGRPLAFVEVGGIDAGAHLIELGLARPRYNSTDGFARHEREALYFELAVNAPSICGNNATPTTPAPPSGNENPAAECNIKGNISRSGERIYHMPGQQHWANTVIDTSAGERWFCSSEEAVAAGWRRALR